MKIAHVISPFNAPKESDIYIAQPLTFSSLEYAAGYSDSGVELFAYLVSEPDRKVVPSSFKALPTAAINSSHLVKSTTRANLPLIREIIAQTLKFSKADIIVYSNVDIAVQPYFYDFILKEMQELDAMVINRRTVSRNIDRLEDLSYFYSQVGQNHPGFDCFVARRHVWDKCFFDNAFVGGNWIGRVILLNLISFSKKFRLEDQAHLTFHLGDDKSWESPRMAAYHSFNERCLIRVCQHISRLTDEHLRTAEFIGERTERGVPVPIQNHVRAISRHSATSLRQDPIFIVGFPRSGTTIMQATLAKSARNLVTMPETHIFRILEHHDLISKKEFSRDECLKIIRSISDFVDVSSSLIEFVDRNHFSISANDFVDLVFKGQILTNHPEVSALNSTWAEKTPSHVLSAGIIKERFYPFSRFVCMIRHPFYAISSWKTHATNWGARDLTIQNLSYMYRSHVSAAVNLKKKYKDDTRLVFLENFVRDSEGEIEKILNFARLDWVSDDSRGLEMNVDYIVREHEDWKRDALNNEISRHIAMPEDIDLNDDEKNFVWDELKSLVQPFGYEIEPFASGTSPLSEFDAD